MAPPRKELEIPEGDPVREYSDEEKLQLTRQLDALLLRVHAGEFSSRPVITELICELHREIFVGVRGHAGRPRAPGSGAEYLTFGPHRSAPHREVASKLKDALRFVSCHLPP